MFDLCTEYTISLQGSVLRHTTSSVDHRDDAHHAHKEEAQASVSLDAPQ